MLMKFRDYERPDGRSPGQPEVLVCRETVDALGMPLVDYDLLEDMSSRIIRKPSTRHPRINLRTISETNDYGSYYPHTYTINADAIKSEGDRGCEAGVITTVAHELQHYADYKTALLPTLIVNNVEMLLHGGRLLTYSLARRAFSGISGAPSFYDTCSIEDRAFAQEQYDNIQPYEQAILFPNSPRTRELILNRQLTTSALTGLGLEQYRRYGNDYKNPVATWFAKVKS